MMQFPLKPYYLIYDTISDQILTDLEGLFFDLTSYDLDQIEDDLSEINQNCVFYNPEEATKIKELVHQKFLEVGEIPEDELHFEVIKIEPMRVTQVVNTWEFYLDPNGPASTTQG